MDERQERQVKHERVREYLKANKLDGVILAKRGNFSWYTCGKHNHVGLATEVGSSWLLVTSDGAKVCANNIEATRLRGEEFPDGDIEIVESPYYDPEAQADSLIEISSGMKLASDVPVASLDLPALGGDFDRLRWQLTPGELDRYRALAMDGVAAIESVARQAEPGQTENHLAGMIAAELYHRNCGFWALFVAGDGRMESYRHPLPTDNRIRKYFMLIACAERDGLVHSCTRIGAFGDVNDELVAKHHAVAKVDAALIGSTIPGRALREIYAEGQSAYESGGFDGQWKLHHQGGPCGYNARDIVVNPTVEEVAMANQAFAWNPSITGTKSEDSMLCLETGQEIMGMSEDWPVIQAEWKGHKFPRADILVR